MKVLICNAGSTSLKFKLYNMPKEEVLAEARVERVGSRDRAIFHYTDIDTGYTVTLESQDIPTYQQGIEIFLDHLLDLEHGALSDIEDIARVGFKTVLAKGYYGVHELTQQVCDAMEEYVSVAPAHNIPYLRVTEFFKELLPKAMLVGAFETDFHKTIPVERRVYGLPYNWYEDFGIQRMGYHGASHAYIAQFLEDELGGTGKTISCHLGGSGSLCAIDEGISMDNSFGMSLQTGLIHSTRVGDCDAYLPFYLVQQGMSLDEIKSAMDKNGGLKGISGISGDMRDIENAAKTGDKRAQLAIDVYCNGIVKYIGSYYAELGGLDNLVFTGGIGENSNVVRETVTKRLGHMGIQLDSEKNSNSIPDNLIISKDGSPVTIWVIPTDEEIIVARKTFSYK